MRHSGSRRRHGHGHVVEEPGIIRKPLLLQLLPLPRLVILEPVKDVLALGAPELPQPRRDLLDLLRSRSTYPLLVQPFEDRNLLLGGVPP